ncbi:phytoene desaturase family protein [Thermoflexibacter ruber]|uniref:Phytoene desaturase n=1 Tax=Thermoflexibacter ruber TaxID=1003 RepID=A0A1I2I0Z6_9BACT|nr:phytoene desaturase family protein [Thermoflexibacter ruber]SFF34747.1 phytoene desaturase [Thermoflexibacter ruber]
MNKKVIVIGAGFAGIAAATNLAHEGFEVIVLEKHDIAGGRARVFEAEGFTYDMGPSWYWMPDVFESYFGKFGKKPSDYYELVRLNPSYRVVFGADDYLDIPADLTEFKAMLESLEKGSASKLDLFLAQAAYKYKVGINDLVYKPSRSIWEFADMRLLLALFRMDVFTSIHKHIRRFFKHPKIVQLMEFPILFLGALPENTPALYSLMNYADISLGTWYPLGGMHQIIKGMVNLAEEKGVKFLYHQEVKSIEVSKNQAKKVITTKGTFEADILIGGADYQHIETQLLSKEYRSYSENYWDSRTLAPSCLIFYLGLNKKLENTLHHTLFFDVDFMQHAKEIYTTPKWPSEPLFYVSVPSKTDKSVAPEGCENVFILIPVAHTLEDTEEVREKYYHIVMDRFERLTKQSIRESVVYKRSYAHKDFIADYHAFKGNAYGLANTLLQTAILKPSLKSKKVENLFYTGQLTVPGPGVPPSLISGQVVAKEVVKEFGRA